MPFKISYTDSIGTLHPDSWWVIGPMSPNFIGRSATFQLFGFHTKADFDAGAAQLLDSPFSYSISDPDTFESRFGHARGGSILPFIQEIENYCTVQDASGMPGTHLLFTGSNQYSPFIIINLIIGAFDQTNLLADFTYTIDSPTADFETGFTVTVNGSPVVVSSAVRGGGNNNRIIFAIPAVTLGDEVELFYDSSVGDLRELNTGNAPISDLSNVLAENLLGKSLNFQLKENTGLMLVVL